MSDQAQPFLLKNLFDETSVGEIADAVEAGLPGFDRELFFERVFDGEWGGRELKQRMRHIATVLHDLLPGDYRTKLGVLLKAAPHTPKGFPALVYSDFVEAFGTSDWEASVPALAVFTRLGSAEFAIRPFIVTDPERTLAQMYEWAGDPDPDVRRLASEGSRPRLPWGMRLKDLLADPSPVLPILEQLRNDPDEVVRRSVANNLNDISKDHPQLVIDVLTGWDPRPGTDLYRLARHALRTLLKRGDAAALAVLGFEAGPCVEVTELAVDPPDPSIGGSARLRFTVVPTFDEPRSVMLDFAVYYVKADRSRSPKVFRLGAPLLEPRTPYLVDRKLSFRQMTTRTHRPGTHRVEVVANGAVAGAVEFELRQEGG